MPGEGRPSCFQLLQPPFRRRLPNLPDSLLPTVAERTVARREHFQVAVAFLRATGSLWHIHQVAPNVGWGDWTSLGKPRDSGAQRDLSGEAGDRQHSTHDCPTGPLRNALGLMPGAPIEYPTGHNGLERSPLEVNRGGFPARAGVNAGLKMHRLAGVKMHQAR
jgi:hypothetical protein